MQKAGFSGNPFEELRIEDRNIIVAPITKLTEDSLKDSGLDLPSIHRCKNMFTLGMACYIYNRPLDYIYDYLESRFRKRHPEMIEPNRKVLNDGFNYAANIQAIANTYTIEPDLRERGIFRNITGNQAIAWGFIAASEKSGLPLFCGSYPITPATAILEELSLHKFVNVKTMQTEDEIAASAVPSSFLRGQSCRDYDVRTGPFPQVRSARFGGDDGIAARGRGRAARGPLHGHADQDGTDRPE